MLIQCSVKICSHILKNCAIKHIQSTLSFVPPQNDQVLQGFSVDKGEFTCPLCRQFANSVLPCRPGRGMEAGAWHTPTNKKTCVLVKEVEDLQERIGLFSVSFTKNTDSQIQYIANNVPFSTAISQLWNHRQFHLSINYDYVKIFPKKGDLWKYLN